MQLIDDCDRVRWLAYFDLLGVKALLRDGQESQVFNAYWAARDHFRNQETWAPELQHAWFSDTFLIMAHDDSAESFKRIESMSRHFASSLICYEIPLRGAIACGRLYANSDKSVIFGSALVEAYEYGEGQDWLGLLLTPTAASRLEALEVGFESLACYTKSVVPWTNPRPTGAPNELWACLIGNDGRRNGRNSCLEHLERMMSRCDSDSVRQKYERTLQFLESHPVAGSDRYCR